jgi:hypothetical protein
MSEYKRDPADQAQNPLAPEVINFDENQRVKVPLTGHQWRQRGTSVECHACEHPHGFSVPPDQLLVGIEDGMPKFETVTV